MDNFAELLLLLKSLLGIRDGDTTRDQELTDYLNGAIGACEKYVDSVINRRPITETWVRVTAPLRLKNYPVGSLTEVTLNGTAATDNWKLLVHDAYAELHRVDGTAYCVGNEELKATYEAGYEQCPFDLMLAIRDTAAVLEAQKGGGASVPGAQIKKEMITGIGNVEYDTSGVRGETPSVGIIPAQAVQILDMYRRLGV